jgi:hypothetical protein
MMGAVKRARHVVTMLLRHEVHILVALFRWVTRRPDVARGDTAIPYGDSVRIVMIGFIVVSAIEVVVMELIVPWPTIRFVLFVLGIYGLVWMVGFAAAVWIRPHTIGPRGLCLRFGYRADVTIPIEKLASARKHLKGSHQKTLEYADGTAAVAVMGVTNVCVELHGPYDIELGRSGIHRISRVRFRADDPATAIHAVTDAIAAHVLPQRQ